ncbi:MAG: hypothetical protein ACRDJK_09255 [Actinomycetota bacterium]
MTNSQLVESGQPIKADLGTVLWAGQDGALVALYVEGEPRSLKCDLLTCSEHGPVRLSEGDSVLVWHSGLDEDRGIIVGRLGPSAAPPAAADTAAEITETPDEIVLEAKHSLTLRVGEGSITICQDGKILIRGKDLVSHAERMNRIKGGAVSIN